MSQLVALAVLFGSLTVLVAGIAIGRTWLELDRLGHRHASDLARYWRALLALELGSSGEAGKFDELAPPATWGECPERRAVIAWRVANGRGAASGPFVEKLAAELRSAVTLAGGLDDGMGRYGYNGPPRGSAGRLGRFLAILRGGRRP